ncbi:ATP-binding protein [Streptomyces monashensis]|uniref:ATP-binding protein n=1 Tax=Streptomyces monashensis TaxID=1678012 RepID=UPI00340D5F3B
MRGGRRTAPGACRGARRVVRSASRCCSFRITSSRVGPRRQRPASRRRAWPGVVGGGTPSARHSPAVLRGAKRRRRGVPPRLTHGEADRPVLRKREVAMDVVDEQHLCGQTPVRRHWVKLAGYAAPSSLARRHVREVLEGRVSPERVDDGVLVASELVGNALRHTVSGPDCMCVEVYREAVVLRVHDAERDVPRVRARSAEMSQDELTGSGLGLLLVGELASAWWVLPTAIGKEVVVVFTLDIGELSERDVLPYIPAVRPPVTAELHQLDGRYREFDDWESAEH